jgi:hypothetical protein
MFGSDSIFCTGIGETIPSGEWIVHRHEPANELARRREDGLAV